MIIYADGTEAKIGDKLDADGEHAEVEAIIYTDQEQASWGVKEPGLMLKGKSFGLMFQPLNSIDWDAIVFLSRGV